LTRFQRSGLPPSRMTSPRASAPNCTVLVHQPCVVHHSLNGNACFISAITSDCVTPGPDFGSTLRKTLRAASYWSASRG
jgi:hypothetical protein